MPPFPIDRKLVVGISSNALFDLTDEDELFKSEGIEAYRIHQIENRNLALPIGPAFPFIKRFLRINEVYSDQKPVEVVLISRNSPETGIRIFNSIEEQGLDITRATFTSGDSPYEYLPSFNVSLFLSTNSEDVKKAIKTGYAAGQILQTQVVDEEQDTALRVAFDFDSVIADDESEKVYKDKGIEAYHAYEVENVDTPHTPGPLAKFFRQLAYFQRMETKRKEEDPSYEKILETAIVTARNAPSHQRAIHTLEHWKVTVDKMFFMGGIEKKRVLEVFKPHLFVDDQESHLDESMENIALVHIPFGVANQSTDSV
ncbi:MAG: 5'-nucleotidase [Balneolaceae bacterium]